MTMLHQNQKKNRCVCMSENCYENTFTVIMMLWGAVCLGIGIYAAVHLTNLSDQQELKDHDGWLWGFNIGACFADFFWAFALVVGLRSFVNDDGRNFVIIGPLFYQIAVTAWAIYVYHYNRDNLYMDYWNQKAPGLLVQVYAHYVYLGVFAFLLVYMLIGSCFAQSMIQNQYNK